MKWISSFIRIPVFFNRGWLSFVLPLVLVFVAAYMAGTRYMRDGAAITEVLVPTPPKQNAVEQLLALQQGLSQLEALIQAGNLFLLKTRALVSSAVPEVSLFNSILNSLDFGKHCLLL